MTLRGKTHDGELPITVIENPIPTTGYFVANGGGGVQHLPLTFDQYGNPRVPRVTTPSPRSQGKSPRSTKSAPPAADLRAQRMQIEKDLLKKYPKDVVRAAMHQMNMTSPISAKQVEKKINRPPYRRNARDEWGEGDDSPRSSTPSPEKEDVSFLKRRERWLSKRRDSKIPAPPPTPTGKISEQQEAAARMLAFERINSRNMLLTAGTVERETIKILEEHGLVPKGVSKSLKEIVEKSGDKPLSPKTSDIVIDAIYSPISAIPEKKVDKILEKVESGIPLSSTESKLVTKSIIEANMPKSSYSEGARLTDEAEYERWVSKSRDLLAAKKEAEKKSQDQGKKGRSEVEASTQAKKEEALEKAQKALRACRKELKTAKKEAPEQVRELEAKVARLEKAAGKAAEKAGKAVEQVAKVKEKAAKAGGSGAACEVVPNAGQKTDKKYSDGKVAKIGDTIRLAKDADSAANYGTLMSVNKRGNAVIKFVDGKKALNVKFDSLVRQAASTKSAPKTPKATETTMRANGGYKKNEYHKNDGPVMSIFKSAAFMGASFGLSGVFHALLRLAADRLPITKSNPAMIDTAIGVVSMGASGAALAIPFADQRPAVFAGLAARLLAHMGRNAPTTLTPVIRQMSGGSPAMTLEGFLDEGEETNLGEAPVIEVDSYVPRGLPSKAEAARLNGGKSANRSIVKQIARA